MTWIQVKANGTTLVDEAGQVLSCNPSRLTPPYGPYYFTFHDPSMPIGPYEAVVVSNGRAVYNPTGHQPVVYGYVEDSPNAMGWGGITELPL